MGVSNRDTAWERRKKTARLPEYKKAKIISFNFNLLVVNRSVESAYSIKRLLLSLSHINGRSFSALLVSVSKAALSIGGVNIGELQIYISVHCPEVLLISSFCLVLGKLTQLGEQSHKTATLLPNSLGI
ncbi:hypothetical protein FRX31_030130 [Thalictrum thalictroides]|uniref:Uncharacterized protein n=1 Tax=Thalictrum thalictroides TaxID=46969 RepID=A0A7J6V7X2_THATH|nr:hypothetical protein FRX31_030130 [Thalictrum thalictroides]